MYTIYNCECVIGMFFFLIHLNCSSIPCSEEQNIQDQLNELVVLFIFIFTQYNLTVFFLSLNFITHKKLSLELKHELSGKLDLKTSHYV